MSEGDGAGRPESWRVRIESEHRIPKARVEEFVEANALSADIVSVFDQNDGLVREFEYKGDPVVDLQSESNSGGIYLAGPIDYADDPWTWRDEVKRNWPDFNWIDPAEKFPEYDGQEQQVVDWGLQQARTHDVLVNNIGDEGPETVGSHHEISEAIHAGNRVAVVPEGQPSPFVSCREVEVYESVEAAIDGLTGGDRRD